MSKTITDLRELLFATLEGVKSGAVELDKARTINEMARTIVETAKVEVDFIRAIDGKASSFIQPKEKPQLPPGVTGSTVHRIAS